MPEAPTTPRTLLITGYSRGIGRAITERLLTEGHSTIGIARSPASPPLVHARHRGIELDIGDLDRLTDRIDALLRCGPAIDGLVACAGTGRFANLESFSLEQIQRLMDVNFTAHAWLARLLLPAMKRRGHGHLIFIGSEAALRGRRQGAIYCASKFALRGLSQALREECSRRGIHVSLINPGLVRSGFFRELSFRPGPRPEHAIAPDDIASIVSQILSGRPGTVFDEINLSPLQNVVVHEPRRTP